MLPTGCAARWGAPSRPFWGEACVAKGRECAAVAVALVSARPVEHFRTSPGGYFHGMVGKAKAGKLNLVRTIWGLRQAKATKERGGGGGGRGERERPITPPQRF